MTKVSKKSSVEAQSASGGTVSKASITLETSVRGRAACWTMFDYGSVLEDLRKYAKEEVKYMVFGFEVCPETGREHLQGYHQWHSPRSLKEFSRRFRNCHIEVAKGNGIQNREYCIKGGKYEEQGEVPKQGTRSDWKKVLEDCKDGKDLSDILEGQPHLMPCQRAIREVKNLMLKPCHREVDVICLVGDSGSGKTRYAYDEYPDLYSKPRGDWWDGYTGQKAILLDDYYGYLPYCELLRVLDRYPYQVPVKGGYVQAQWNTVLITSNKMPQYWYRDGLTPALRRRLKTIIHCKLIDGVSSFDPLPLCEEEEE